VDREGLSRDHGLAPSSRIQSWSSPIARKPLAELLRAGADVDCVVGPTGSEALDALLRAHGWRAE
jgi:hypothetical protein